MTELALPGMGRELGIGLLIGAGLYTACILMVMGIYRIDWLNPVSYLQPAVARRGQLVRPFWKQTD